jgi:hypothetical protein
MELHGAYLKAAVHSSGQFVYGKMGKARLHPWELHQEQPEEQEDDDGADDSGRYVSCLSDDKRSVKPTNLIIFC